MEWDSLPPCLKYEIFTVFLGVFTHTHTSSMSNGNILSILCNFETLVFAVCQAHVLWVDGRKVSQCSLPCFGELSRNNRVLGRKGEMMFVYRRFLRAQSGKCSVSPQSGFFKSWPGQLRLSSSAGDDVEHQPRKRKIIFKSALEGDTLVSRVVYIHTCISSRPGDTGGVVGSLSLQKG